jgi:hypothetical protein
MDTWIADPNHLDNPDLLDRLRAILADESPVVVEHRYYRGARAPSRFVVDEFDQLIAYLREHAIAGDWFYFWHFSRCCTDDNVLASAKKADASGRTPKGGAY